MMQHSVSRSSSLEQGSSPYYSCSSRASSSSERVEHATELEMLSSHVDGFEQRLEASSLGDSWRLVNTKETLPRDLAEFLQAPSTRRSWWQHLLFLPRICSSWLRQYVKGQATLPENKTILLQDVHQGLSRSCLMKEVDFRQFPGRGVDEAQALRQFQKDIMRASWVHFECNDYVVSHNRLQTILSLEERLEMIMGTIDTLCDQDTLWKTQVYSLMNQSIFGDALEMASVDGMPYRSVGGSKWIGCCLTRHQDLLVMDMFFDAQNGVGLLLDDTHEEPLTLAPHHLALVVRINIPRPEPMHMEGSVMLQHSIYGSCRVTSP